MKLLLGILKYGACILCLYFSTSAVDIASGQSSVNSAKVGDMKHEPSPLEATLRADRKTYKLGDQITVQVLLTNRSKSPLYIYSALDWGESASLSLWLKDLDSGKSIPQEFIADALPPPPGSKEAFVRLLPSHVYGVILTLKLAELNIHKKGAYELHAEYHSPIPENMNFGLPIWSREKGALPSNRVNITVEE